MNTKIRYTEGSDLMTAMTQTSPILIGRAGETELGLFDGAKALFSDVSEAMKIFGSSSFYPIIKKM